MNTRRATTARAAVMFLGVLLVGEGATIVAVTYPISPARFLGCALAALGAAISRFGWRL